MKNACVTLVDPKQIAKKGYSGCKSTKAVVSFAKKYGVPCLWWKPMTGQKVLLVDMNQFGSTWKQVQGGNWSSGSNTKTSSRSTGTARKTGSSTNWKGAAKRGTAKKSTSRYGNWNSARSTNSSKKSNGSGTGKGATSKSNAKTTLRKMTSAKSGRSTSMSSKRTNARSNTRMKRAA